MTSDHQAPPGVRGTGAKTGSTVTITPAASASDTNWRWARRIEAKERIADAELRKEVDAAIKTVDPDR